MLILSQDRTALLNYAHFASVRTDGNRVLAYDSGHLIATELGVYSDSDHAEKVVAEIAEEYAKYFRVDGGPIITQPGGFVQPFMFEPPKVYKMPAYQ